MNTRQSSKKEWTLERKNALMGYIMVSPILVGILLFTVVPVFFSLYISFTDWDMLHPQTWVGLQNYQTIFSDKMLGIVTKNTLVYCVIAIPGAILFGMLLALAMNTKIRGVALYRTAFFMPNITTTVAVCIVWSWLYNKDYGLFNNLLKMVGWSRSSGFPPKRWPCRRWRSCPSGRPWATT